MTPISMRFVPPAIPKSLIARLPDSKNGKPDRFGVIIGLNTEDRHRGNISLAYQVMIESGMKEEDIFILDIASTTPIFPKTDTTSLASVRLLMQRLAEIVEGEDDVIIYVTGHGTFIENEPYLVLNPSELMASREFLASLEAVVPGRGLVIFDQCYWSIEFHPKSCRWTTMTVAPKGRVSVGSVFSRQFWYLIRSGVLDIIEAFVIAQARDDAMTSKENDPDYVVRTCGNESWGSGMLRF